ncbi:BTAD domain-containing putative transcriptional regulator [Micromonospora sp. NPDC049559]|uniref:AfsR/SARP family transcriptional regulator n=1 Tax=Micromonospora sp. NPDC049559 TaxID=3155923 RepID=UPI00343B0FBE
MRQGHGDSGASTADAEPGWDFRILGPWEINDAGAGVAVPARQTRVLLSSLLLSANRPVPVEALTRQLWPEQTPDRVRPTLHTYVARLRKLLGKQLIRTTTGGGYQLDVPADSVDLHRFRTLVHRAGTAATPGTELALLRAALRLWRGRPFTGVPSPWLDRDVVPLLIEEWFAATERRIDLDLAAGPATATIVELRDLTTGYPARESLWLRLIAALHLAGRRADALDAYRQVRAFLRTELGVDPNPALQRLQRAVLVGEVPEPYGVPAAPPARPAPGAGPCCCWTTPATPTRYGRSCPARRAW